MREITGYTWVVVAHGPKVIARVHNSTYTDVCS